jgi:hypothetical protein
MKKILFVIAIACISIQSISAQNLLSKVPDDALLVIKYGAENFSKSVPVKKLDTYNFLKDALKEFTSKDTISSIESMGIDFEQDAYQYVANTVEDTTINFVTVMNIKNSAQFVGFVKNTYGSKKQPQQKNGYQLLNLSKDVYLGWNDKTAFIINSSYQNKKSYYDYKYANDTTEAYAGVEVTTEVAVSDSKIDIIQDKVAVEVAPKDKPKKNPKVTNGYKKPVVKNKPKGKVKPKVKAIVEDYDTIMARQDSIENRKRDLWEQQQDFIANKKQEASVVKIIENSLGGKIKSIENTKNYSSIIEPAAHMSVWVNSGDLVNKYQNYFSYRTLLGRYNKPLNGNYEVPKKIDTTDGFKSAVNVYFEKDRMRMVQKNFSASSEMTKLGKDIMNNKQTNGLLGLINPGNMGYFSMSISTEAMLNYYYAVAKQYIATTPYMNEYSEVANVYIDLLQIMMDEKGIGDLATGNYMFVMHDMKTKMVEYTTYDYDKEYKMTEVKKTKKELSPNFTFAMETRRPDFMERLAKLPLKYAEKERYNYKDRGGYYELSFDSSKYPVSSMFFMVKDGKAITTTSKEVITNAMNNISFAIDGDTKNSVLNNNYSIKIDSKKMFEVLEAEASTKDNKKVLAYMKNNMGNIKTESSYKDGMIQGVTTIDIKGNHTNSLEFIFNTLEYLKSTYDNRKAEELKKAD